jgi:hypothetical protein
LGDPSSITVQGPMIGTPGYMAPEQILSRPVDGRADVYALGLVLFQLVAGRHPFSDVRGFTEMMAAQVHQPTPPLQGAVPELQLPPGLEEVVQRATRKDPAERFQKMEELIEALAPLQRASAPHAAEGGFEKTSRVKSPTTALRPGGSRRWVAAGVAVAVAGALAVAGMARRGPAPAPPPPPPVAERAPEAALPPAPLPSQAAREVQRVLARQTALDVLVKSRTELSVGNLEGARQILDGSREALEVAAADPQLRPQLDALQAELGTVAEALARAQALAKRGDCAGAIRLYDQVLKEHSGIRQARAAREQCRRMLPPQMAE